MTPECIDADLGRLITAYEFNQLNEADRCNFENHLMNCPFCQQELEKMGPLVFNLRENRRELLQSLARKGARFTLAEKPQADIAVGKQNTIAFKLKQLLEEIRRPVIWIPVAAAALILILVLPRVRPSNPYLPYLDYSKPQLEVSSFRSPGAPSKEAQDLFSTGMEKYSQDRYGQAANYLEKAIKQAPDEKHWWFYLGLSRYLDHHPQAAVQPLETALTGENKKVQSMARWYLAQVWLAQGEAAKARPLLEEAIRLGDDYAVRADSLLARIKTIK